MSIKVVDALAAYGRPPKPEAGMNPRSGDPAQSFADLVSDSVKAAVETGVRSEEVSARAIAGKAELNEVVTAVTNAEVTLKTVLAVRDRVIQAYQDIIRMPV